MAKQNSLNSQMENAWQSERLIYRAVEDTDEDRKYLHEAINNDPVIFGNSWRVKFKPQSQKVANEYYDVALKNDLLAVWVCLRPAQDDSSLAQLAKLSGRTSSTGNQTKNNEKTLPPSRLSLKPIGMVNLFSGGSEAAHHRNAMMGIHIDSAYRGQGYGAETINWVVDWAFIYGAQHRVSLSCYSFNEGALRLYEKLGFVKEGLRRECVWFGRKWHDELDFGMLESDWERHRNHKE
jgi:RimJ/RimL family protein N-acetyltransferase